MKSLRIMVVGCGFMGQTHAANALDCPGLELCALVDSRPRRDFLARAGGNLKAGGDAKRLEKIPLFANVEEALMATSPQAAIICLPTFLHYETARLCLERNCHVLLEKPICLDPELGEDLVNLADRVGRILMVAHCVRFFPAYEVLAAVVRSGELGALRLLNLHRFSGQPDWGCWRDEQVRRGSGGALFDLVIHDFDFALGLLGEPESVWTPPCLAESFGTDYVSAVWRYSPRDKPAAPGSNSGAVVAIQGGNCFPPERPFDCGYSALFERGLLLYQSAAPERVWRYGNPGAETGEKRDCVKKRAARVLSAKTGRPDALFKTVAPAPGSYLAVAGAETGYRRELAYFANCAQTKKSPQLCPPQDAVAAVRMARRHLAASVEKPGRRMSLTGQATPSSLDFVSAQGE